MADGERRDSKVSGRGVGMKSERNTGADQPGPREERQRISILFYRGSLGGVGVCGMGRRNRRRGGGDWEAGGPQSLKPSWSTQSKPKAPHGSLVFAAFRETRETGTK